MKNIADTLTKYRKYYAERCTYHQGGYAKIPLGCACETVAQVYATIEATIPDEYTRYEIADFTGMKDGKRLVKPEIVAAAKHELISYCWQGIDPDDYGNADWQLWWPKSAMEKRRKFGNNIVIYGNPWMRQTNGAAVKTFKAPIGRTMLASIVMKEAIRMKMRSGHMSDTYGWTSFGRLTEKLMQQAKDNSIDSEISHLQYCDWLCVDGFEIEKQNEATRMFKAKVLDNFFDQRLNEGLPNILVFQDDLSVHDDLRPEFGLSVNSIINSPKTTRVKMLDKEGK